MNFSGYLKLFLLFFISAFFVNIINAQSLTDTALYRGIKARSIGPSGMSGRVTAIEAVEKDPNIIYAESQYGGLVRYDKKSGEQLYIKPYDYADTAYRFDWDAALLISKYDNKKLLWWIYTLINIGLIFFLPCFGNI